MTYISGNLHLFRFVHLLGVNKLKIKNKSDSENFFFFFGFNYKDDQNTRMDTVKFYLVDTSLMSTDPKMGKNVFYL